MTADLVLASVEARLLADGAYEALWHLERMDPGETALLVEREVREGNHEPACGNPQVDASKVAA